MSVRAAIGVLAVLGLVGGVSGYALAQEQPGIGVVSTLIGEATVARGTTTQPLALKMRDDVFMQDRISTKERSLVHVLLGGKALLTVRELSVLTITEDGGRATIDLQSGKVGLAVVRQRMKPGEIIEIRTPHAVAAVRGTVLVVEIVPGAENQASAASTDVHLLHGKLDVSLVSNPTAPPIQLESLQSVTASNLALGRVRPLTPESVAAVTANLKMNRPSRPGPSDKFVAAIGEKQRTLAVATASTLMNAGHHKGRPAGHGGQFAAAQKGKGIHAVSDQDSIATITDVSDGNAGAVGIGRAGALDLAGGNVSGSSLVGVSSISAGTAIRLQGPIGGPVGGTLGSALAPIVPKLMLLPQVQ